MYNIYVICRSLLATAINNIHHEKKVDPIPMQYETLRGITKDCYSQHFDSLHHGVDLHKIYDDMEDNDYVEYEGKFKKELIINSINKNELCTVTLQFYKVPDDGSEECVDILDIIEHKIEAFKTEWRLYTANCKF